MNTTNYMFYDGLNPAHIMLCEHEGCIKPAKHEISKSEIDSDGTATYYTLVCDKHLKEAELCKL